jgi:hypothetical protein
MSMTQDYMAESGYQDNEPLMIPEDIDILYELKAMVNNAISLCSDLDDSAMKEAIKERLTTARIGISLFIYANMPEGPTHD